MLRALALALSALFDRRLIPLWLKSVGVTLAIFAILGFGLWAGLMALLRRYSDLGGFGELAAVLIVVLAGWLLWRIIALAVLQFLADEVVQTVEAQSYPDRAAQARSLGLAEEARRALSGIGRVIGYNLLALPFAAMLMVTAIGPALVFFAVNAVLLGRELQDMVWLRHQPSPGSPAPLSSTERFVLGGLITMLLSVPLVNFVAPFLGAACAVHLIHRKGIAS